MSQRAIGIFVAVTGLFFVVFLILLRFDLQQAARKGPRWKRNLVLAGVFVLSTMGLVSTTTAGCTRQPTCYLPPMPLDYQTRQSIAHLSERLPLLEKFAASEKLERGTVKVVLATIEGDIAVLEKEEGFSELSEEEREAARELLQKVKAHVNKIRANLGNGNTQE